MPKKNKKHKEKVVKPINKTRFLAEAGIIAALYVVLTFISFQFGLSTNAVQIRISEALCILPCFTAAAVPGLFVGCLLSNILTGSVIWDIIFGSLATLLAAFCTRQFRKNRYLACLPPILINSFVVPLVLVKGAGVDQALEVVSLSVALGEIISCGVLGQILYTILNKNKNIFKG